MGIAVRLVIDTGIQIFGPYLSQIAAGLGISIVMLGALNSLRSLMGLAGPGFASLATSRGYRQTMRFQSLLGAAGVFIFSFSSDVWMAAIGMILMGLGIFSIAPVLQAYMSAHIPYERRARGLGTVEYAWALAGILGLSLAGLLMARFSWRAPFWLIGMGLLGAFFVFGMLPAARSKRAETKSKKKRPSLRRWLAQLRELVKLDQNVNSAWGAIIAGGLSVFAVTNVSIIFGTWLGNEYGLNTAQIGLVALTLGLADLVGVIFVSRFADRIGKYRVVLFSTAGAVFAYLLLPVLNFGLLAAVLGLIVTRLCFETGIVSNISLLSEQVPRQRAKVLTLASAIVTLGVAASSLSGPFVYSNWGVLGLGLVSAAAVLLATLLIIRLVSEKQSSD
jgi:predicted MFS family arabinose efflux permease